MNSFPHTDGTLTEALADGKFQEEERNAEKDQADKVWNKKRTFYGRNEK